MRDLWRRDRPAEQLAWALRDVNLEIEKGATATIIGRNGSGKSTLLNVIGGLLKPTTGAVWVDGRTSALIELAAGSDDWPAGPYDAVYTANTCHIMSWPEVQGMFRGIGRVLAPGGMLCIYGPFNRGGQFTSASNAAPSGESASEKRWGKAQRSSTERSSYALPDHESPTTRTA